MQYECSNIECGAVFQYDRQSCGHHVPPNRCPVCGSTNPVESGSEAAKAVEAKHDAILAAKHDAILAGAEDRTRTGNTPTELLDPESDEAEALLDAAKEAQTAFWAALHDLEKALGVEIESTQDLRGMTCPDLTSEEDEMEQERRTR